MHSDLQSTVVTSTPISFPSAGIQRGDYILMTTGKMYVETTSGLAGQSTQIVKERHRVVFAAANVLAIRKAHRFRLIELLLRIREDFRWRYGWGLRWNLTLLWREITRGVFIDDWTDEYTTDTPFWD